MEQDKQPTIGVVMIVKNEMEYLERCLESVKDADAIYIADTGSTDGGATINIARKYTPNVYTDYAWNDNFAEARNYIKAKAETDWCLSIDADEFLHDFSKVREVVALADAQDIKAVNILQIAESDGQTNIFPRLFRNLPGIFWNGAAHNSLNMIGGDIGEVKLTYGYSLAHLADPDRTMRILEKEYKAGRAGAREMYYLAREYWYRKRYGECTAILGKYIQISKFPAERADAFLMMARAYWQQRMADDARDACAQAIVINANFREALLFMSELSWPSNASRWREFAQLASNIGVLFVRT